MADRHEVEQMVWEHRELQKLCQHMVRRRMELRTRQVRPERQTLKEHLLLRYKLDIQKLTGEIIGLGDRIFALQADVRCGMPGN